MKNKTIVAFIAVLTLSMSLSACGKNDSFPQETGSNSDTAQMEELEQRIKELEAENEELKAQLDNSDLTDSNQQSTNEAETLLQATIQSPETSGVCGANLTWSYKNGVLAITGTGEMTDYSSYKDAPWYELRDKIGWIIIDDGVTTVGENVFTDYNEVSKIVLPNTLVSIGECSFENCSSIKEITFKGNVPEGLEVSWFSLFNNIRSERAMTEGYEPTEEDILREIGKNFIPMTIYYTNDTFDEFINSYPYWSDYGVNWIKQ